MDDPASWNGPETPPKCIEICFLLLCFAAVAMLSFFASSSFLFFFNLNLNHQHLYLRYRCLLIFWDSNTIIMLITLLVISPIFYLPAMTFISLHIAYAVLQALIPMIRILVSYIALTSQLIRAQEGIRNLLLKVGIPTIHPKVQK